MVTHNQNSCSAFNPSKVHKHSSEHTPGAVGSHLCCGARGAVGGSVPCSRAPQLWYCRPESRLKELVPSLPQNKSVSKMEILQHVIDYILDLQIALDQNPQQQILGQSPPKKTVRSLGAGSIISFQPSNTQGEINSDDLITL
uniref:Inhibitor of DNA binding 2b n=1 Tax=Cyprinus carpio TaxID=7962 RepID=A0A8C2JQL1_CYPCA